MATNISNFKIKVAIAEDCKYFSDKLSGDLKDVDGITISSVSPNGKVLINDVKKSPPDVVLMDIRMDIMDGIEATKAIKEINPDIRVIAWSVHCDFHSRIKMFEAGASAFLDKDADLKEIIKCIKAMYENGFYYNQYLNKEMHESIMNREKEVIYLVDGVLLPNDDIRMITYIAADMTIAQMSEKFFVNPKTIERRRKALYNKTNTGGIGSLVKFGVNNGIV